MAKIDSVDTKIIQDSRDKDTIEVTLSVGSIKATASVPAGKSKGEHEAVSHSAQDAEKIITQLTSTLVKTDFSGPTSFDQFLIATDGTVQKSNLGGNTTLALSIAFLRLWAQTNRLQLHQAISQIAGISPTGFPMFFSNVINGGLHVDQNFNPLAFQEYMVVPQSKSPTKSLEIVNGIIETIKNILTSENHPLNFGDEGGFIVSGDNPEDGLKILEQALKTYQSTEQSKIALDIAASSFWDPKNQKYSWRSDNWTTQQLIDLYQKIVANYPIMSIEDPFNQDNFDDWGTFHQITDDSIWIVGDDLTVTNTKRIEEAKQSDAANAMIIKPNQIGTFTETIEAIKMARRFGWKIIVSHRSGETEDDFIADLAYGVAADGLKAGSPLQKERLVKYQRLIEIENS
ncbi:hypothetical protein M1563_04495 [Patescibacteria group bacterium]|nr:hypothetical protein [Patescibacteria group bacterium]